MKKHTTISIALLALLCCACEEKQVGGDWDFHDAYILDGENLIEAHGYTVELPAQQCTVDLQIVSSGIYNQQSIDLDHFGMNLPDAISVTLTKKLEEAEIYDYNVDSWGVVHKDRPRYLQTVSISAKQNAFKLPRIVKFRIWTPGALDSSAADITVRQAGTK